MSNRRAGETQKSVVLSVRRTFRSFGSVIPMLLGIILLLGLFRTFVSKQIISSVFTGRLLPDALNGALVGSFSAGNPITSYVIGGELLKEGVSLLAVTAFIVTWVTVGIIQLQAEASFLGRRFALTRNTLSFALAILVSLATVMTLKVIQ